MSFQPGANLYTQGFGSRSEEVEVPHVEGRSPQPTDNRYPVGKHWVDNVANAEYTLTSINTFNGVMSAVWTTTTGGGVQSIAGTANQISASASTGAVTLSTPGTFIAPGSIASTTSITAGTTVTATLGAITATNGNLNLATAGNKLLIAVGSNASVGVTAAMADTPGAVTVSSSAITTSSIILYSRAVTGGTTGQVSITSQITGAFTLTSDANETSTFNYLIIN